MGKRWHTDLDVFNLLRKTQPDAELAALFQSIKLVPGMQKPAEKMQGYLIEASSPAIHRWMNEVWLGAGETPQSVYNILRLGKKRLADSPKFHQWLRFTEKYKIKMGGTSDSDRDTLNFLLKARPLTPEVNLAAVFQSLKTIPDLKRLGDSLERNLFRRWMASVNSQPKDVARMLDIAESVPKLPRNDFRYKILEAYTLQFAAENSGKEALKRVKEPLVANNLDAALTAAVKAP